MTVIFYHTDGYYTYEQVLEIIDCVSKDVNVDYPYHDGQFMYHLNDIRNTMERYKMKIYRAKDLLGCDRWRDSVIDTYNILPSKFNKDPSYNYSLRTFEHINSAPNFRESGICCNNCKYYSDETGQDETNWGICEIHTTTDKDYEPNLIVPLTVNPTDICDDYCEG